MNGWQRWVVISSRSAAIVAMLALARGEPQHGIAEGRDGRGPVQTI